MKIGSLCTGYGGLDMAVEYLFNAETIWCAEIDKYASSVIKQNFNIPNYGDIKTLDWNSLPQIDILTAGYPCQPFSHAGQRKGKDDPRHLWPYINKAIQAIRPRFVILENVRGHLNLGFEEVLKDFTQSGYDAKWAIVRAADVGAPHRRERLFIIAQPSDADCVGSNLGEFQSKKRNQGQSQSESCQCGETIADADDSGRIRNMQRLQSGFNSCSTCNSDNEYQSYDWQVSKLGRRFATRCEMQVRRTPNPLDLENKLNPEFVEYMMGLPEGWVTNKGLSRAQQLKMLGNGVVPQQAEYAIKQIMEM